MEEQLTSAFASLGCHTGQKQIRADVAAYVGVPKSSSMKRSNASTSERPAKHDLRAPIRARRQGSRTPRPADKAWNSSHHCGSIWNQDLKGPAIVTL